MRYRFFQELVRNSMQHLHQERSQTLIYLAFASFLTSFQCDCLCSCAEEPSTAENTTHVGNVCTMCTRHMGHKHPDSLTSLLQPVHTTECPHGRKVTVLGASMQIMHVRSVSSCSSKVAESASRVADLLCCCRYCNANFACRIRPLTCASNPLSNGLYVNEVGA